MNNTDIADFLDHEAGNIASVLDEHPNGYVPMVQFLGTTPGEPKPHVLVIFALDNVFDSSHLRSLLEQTGMIVANALPPDVEVQAVAFTAEAWLSEQDPDIPHIRPADDPERVEVVVAGVATRDCFIHRTVFVTRDREGGLVWERITSPQQGGEYAVLRDALVAYDAERLRGLPETEHLS